MGDLNPATNRVFDAGSHCLDYAYDPLRPDYGNSPFVCSPEERKFEVIGVLNQRLQAVPQRTFTTTSGAANRVFYQSVRDYDSVNWVFVWPNRDPIQELGGINLYDYVLNDPINRIDPYGLDNIYNMAAGNNAVPNITLSGSVNGGPVTTQYNGGGLGDPLFLIGGMTVGGMAATATIAENSTIALISSLLANQALNSGDGHGKKKDCPPNGSNTPTVAAATKADIKYIDYLQDKYGLTNDQRERLHEEITGQNLPRSEIDSIAKSFVDEGFEGPIEY